MIAAIALLLQATVAPSTSCMLADTTPCARTSTGAHARRLRAWDATGQPVVVITYTFPVAKPNDTVTVVDLQLQQGDSTASRVTAWHVEVSASATGGRTARGIFVAPDVRPLAGWALTATTPDARLIGTAQDRGTAVDDGAITLSDLLLSDSSNRVVWDRGGEPMALAIEDQFDHREKLLVNYQVRSAAAHDNVRTTLTVTDISDRDQGKRIMQISFASQLRAGINSLDQEVDMTRTHRGHYRIELQVADQQGGGASVRAVEFGVQ